MRKYLMILFIAVSILTANSQNVRTVHLDGQSLEEILGDDILSIDSIAITGKITRYDYTHALAKACCYGRLSGIDLSGCETEKNKVWSLVCASKDKVKYQENIHYFRFPKNTVDVESTFTASKIYEMNLPPTLRSIGYKTFQWANFKNDLWIPEGVDSIAAAAFSHANLPKNVYLPASLQVIFPGAFEAGDENTSPVNLWCKWTTPPDFTLENPECAVPYNPNPFDEPFGREGFFNAYKFWTLYVPAGTKQNYEKDKYFGKFEKIVEYDPAVLAGIQRAGVADKPSAAPLAIYTISGQYVGTDFNSLPSGVYVMRGKKVVK